MSELREKGGLFTSDLTVNGWALAHQLGLRPLSQVMGSSIYQMGYQSSWGQLEGGYDPTGANMFELTTLSQALNEVRTRALGRLAQEAMHVGADAVVEVDTRAGESSLETGTTSLEHTVFGTAVRREAGLANADTRKGNGAEHGANSTQAVDMEAAARYSPSCRWLTSPSSCGVASSHSGSSPGALCSSPAMAMARAASRAPD